MRHSFVRRWLTRVVGGAQELRFVSDSRLSGPLEQALSQDLIAYVMHGVTILATAAHNRLAHDVPKTQNSMTEKG
jgi:hypothetical protein